MSAVWFFLLPFLFFFWMGMNYIGPLNCHGTTCRGRSHVLKTFLPKGDVRFVPLYLIFVLIFVLSGMPGSVFAENGEASPSKRPNVIVIMSDDQGGGDYGFLGNTIIQTPQLDAMAARSGLLNQFYVSPVCAPTRACLMTGRYNYRTRCIDTYIGRAMMDPSEITIAEILRDAGYQTGIYGKWHLGDNYPLRAMDQGFQDSLVHRGGGIGQPSDPIGAEGKYTDPTLIRNGIEVPMKGYCTDIYFDAALEFIDDCTSRGKNFFTYIATNAPHGPFHDVPQELYEKYRKIDFSPILINRKLNAKRLQAENDKLARIAAMITNIDQNVGRLFARLDALKIRENTIVIYLNDNGPNSMRYVGDMRGMKSHVDDGGIRSPLIFHWPAKVKAGRVSGGLAAHIDLLPTLVEACGLKSPGAQKIDGRSFLPLLTGEDVRWPTRQLVLQSHRGDQPQLYHHFALHEQTPGGPHWKLVHPSGFGREKYEGEPKLELYDLAKDPFQRKNLAQSHPGPFERLKGNYEMWFESVGKSRPDNYAPPRIVIGSDRETRTVLTRQDWRHTGGRPWAADSVGHWLLEGERQADYQLEVVLTGDFPRGKAVVRSETLETEIELAAGKRRGHFAQVSLPRGKVKLEVEVQVDGKTRGAHQVILTRK